MTNLSELKTTPEGGEAKNLAPQARLRSSPISSTCCCPAKALALGAVQSAFRRRWRSG